MLAAPGTGTAIPGAACDIDSYIYMPMLEDIGDMPSRKYPPAPELLEHARKIARKYDLYRDAVFQTAITDLKWDEAASAGRSIPTAMTS